MGLAVGVVILPDLDWPEAVVRWQSAEAIGFSSAWTYDHLSWRSLRDGPWLGAIPLLAAVASVTNSLRIGTLVMSPNFRHPALLAKDAMTIDRISGGRLDLGIGAGGSGYDAAVLGMPPLSPVERADRFDEFVHALDLLLRQPSSSFAGEFYDAVDSRTLPGCVQAPRVPFTVAAAGPKALRVAAAYGQNWVTFGPTDPSPAPGDWYAGVRDQVVRFEDACSQLGRDPAVVRRVALISLDLAWAQASIPAWDDHCGHLVDLGFTEVLVHWPRPLDPQLPGPPLGVFDEICNRIASP